MKRFRTFTAFRRLFFGILVLLLFVDVAGELGWLSGLLKPLCRGWLFERGIDVRLERLSVGLMGGLRARGVVVYDPNRPECPVFDADNIQVIPDYGRLFRGSLRPTRIQVGSGVVSIPRSLIAEGDSRYININDIEAAAEICSDGIRIRGATASLSGIQLKLSADVSDIGRFRSQGSGRGGHGLSIPVGRKRGLEAFLEFLDQQTFPERDARIDAHLGVSLANPFDATASGSFVLPDIAWKNGSIRKTKGDFSWEKRRLNLQRFSVFLGAGNMFFGQLQIDTQAATASGDIQAYLKADMLLNRLNLQQYAKGADLHALTPVFCRLQFPHVPLQWDAFKGSFSAQASHISIADLDVSRISLKATCLNGTWKTDEARVELADGNGEALAADLTYSVSDKSLRGTVQGRGRVLKRLKQAGVPIPGDYAGCVGAAPLDIVELTLRQGGDTKGQFHLNGTVNLHGLVLGEQPLHHLKASFALTDQQLTVTDVDVAVKGSDTVVALAKGSCHLNLNTRQVTARMKGACPTDVAVRLLPAGRAQDVMKRFGNGIAEYDFVLSESPWQPARWNADVAVIMHDSRFETLAFDQLQTKVDLSPGIIHAVVSMLSKSEQVKADVTMDVKTATRELMLSADGTMDLRQIRVFLPPVGRGRRVYDKIWQDFEWTPGVWPQIRVESMGFISRHSNRVWELELEGHVGARKLVYRGVELDSLDCKVKLDLPAKVMITDMAAVHSTGKAMGEVKFFLRREPACHLSVQGIFSPDAILGSMLPAWDGYKQKIGFAVESELDIEGKIPLRDKSKVKLSGSIKAPSMTLAGMSLDAVKSSWRWENHRLTIDSFEGELCGGPTHAVLDYQTKTGNGLLSMTFQEVDLNELICQFRPDSKERNQGKLEGGVNLTLSRREVDRQLLLLGPGSVRIVDGNIWEIPLFRKLGELLRLSPLKMLSSLGRIANLDAELEFKGDRVEVPNLVTDGTIVSLKGSGNYFWPSQGLDFRVQGVLLKRTLVVPLATRLLSWIFEAELGGTVKEPDWKLVSALRRTFFGGGKDGPAEVDPEEIDEEAVDGEDSAR